MRKQQQKKTCESKETLKDPICLQCCKFKNTHINTHKTIEFHFFSFCMKEAKSFLSKSIKHLYTPTQLFMKIHTHIYNTHTVIQNIRKTPTIHSNYYKLRKKKIKRKIFSHLKIISFRLNFYSFAYFQASLCRYPIMFVCMRVLFFFFIVVVVVKQHVVTPCLNHTITTVPVDQLLIPLTSPSPSFSLPISLKSFLSAERYMLFCKFL